MSKIGVVVPVLNNFKGFAELVESAKSRNELVWYVQPQHRAQVPLSAAWNKGLRDAIADGCDYIAILNDDILLSPQSLDRMALGLKTMGKEFVLISANNIYGELPNPYDILNRPEQDVKEMTFSEHPNYSCFMVRKDYPERVGWFDENFVPAWFEDNDSHRRIKLLGLKATTVTSASCVHFGGVTTSKMENPNSAVSKEYYIKKWGGLPDSHPVADELKETFTHPYNDETLSPREWRQS